MEKTKVVIEAEDAAPSVEAYTSQNKSWILLRMAIEISGVLAKTNKEAFEAFKAEMEETLRGQLIAQAEKGKRVRRGIAYYLVNNPRFRSRAGSIFYSNHQLYSQSFNGGLELHNFSPQ